MSTARSPRLAACCTTPVATRFTRCTGDDLRRRLPPLLRTLFRPPFRPLFRPLDFREAALPERLAELRLRLLLRAPLLRAREDLRPPPPPPPPALPLPPARLLREPPALLRPDDPERDRFLPPLEPLDFLAAAIAKLHCRRVRVPRVARFAHNTTHVAATCTGCGEITPMRVSRRAS